MARRGLLLINLGTPKSTEVEDVRSFLREFLSDPWVIDSPAPARLALVNLIICPIRGPKSAAAYRKVWTDEGSPLMVHAQALVRKVAALLPERRVALAMRYQQPSIASVLNELHGEGVHELTVLPLYPQRAGSTTETTIEKVRREAGRISAEFRLDFVPDFFDHPGFIDPQARLAAPLIEDSAPDAVVFSFHGVPESHLRRDDPKGSHCLWSRECCAAVGENNRGCYRAHCEATRRALVNKLGLDPRICHTSFQSRFGPQRWTQPATDTVIDALAERGAKRVVVLCPAFVADCIETIEEIGIELRHQFIEAGGEELVVVPCVNAEDDWAQGVVDIVNDYEAGSSSPAVARGSSSLG
jgi:protoporphyrin/coproporphyrin ferrochelatase